MPQPTAFAAIIFALAWLTPPALATGDQVATDANLVTGLDVSDSIMRHDEWIEVEGMARAIVHPRFLDAALSGHHGRIGFAAYVWSSHGNLRVIVPWTSIASTEDAERVAGVLGGMARIDRSYHQGGD